MPHIISIAELTEILKLLRPKDELILNQVGNLSIVRDGNYIGYIDLAHNVPQADRLTLLSIDAPVNP